MSDPQRSWSNCYLKNIEIFKGARWCYLNGTKLLTTIETLTVGLNMILINVEGGLKKRLNNPVNPTQLKAS